MKLIPVEAVPKRRGRHHLQDLIEEFVRGDDKVVQIDFSDHDYKSAKVCRSCSWRATLSILATPSRCRFVRVLFT